MLAAKDRDIARLTAHNTKLQAELLAATAMPPEPETEQGVMAMLASGIAQAHAAASAAATEPPNGKKVRT